MMTSCGRSSRSERCTFCSVRICSIWLATMTALVISRSSSRGVPTLTAMMMSAPSCRARSIGRLRTSPPSTRGRPFTRSGANTPGTAMEARRASKSGVSAWSSMAPESRSVATARKGMGRRRSGSSVRVAGSSEDSVASSCPLPAAPPGSMAPRARLNPNSMREGRRSSSSRRRMDSRSRAGRSARMAFQLALFTRASSSSTLRPEA